MKQKGVLYTYTEKYSSLKLPLKYISEVFRKKRKKRYSAEDKLVYHSGLEMRAEGNFKIIFIQNVHLKARIWNSE